MRALFDVCRPEGACRVKSLKLLHRIAHATAALTISDNKHIQMFGLLTGLVLTIPLSKRPGPRWHSKLNCTLHVNMNLSTLGSGILKGMQPMKL